MSNKELMVKTAKRKFIALLDTKLSTRDKSSWLEQELLNYLDDHHQSICMLRHKRLPGWVKRSIILSNLYYGYQLLFHPRTMVILDAQLLPTLGLMIKLVKQLKHHLVIIAGSSLKQELFIQHNKMTQWLLNLSLKAMDFYFIDTALIHRWLLEKRVEHSKIMVLENAYNHHQPAGMWGNKANHNKAIKKMRQRQFNQFFEHVI